MEKFKGFFIDGAGGDLSFAGTIIKEGSRLAASTHPVGNFGMQLAGIETTQEKISSFVQNHGPDAVKVIQILNDPVQREILANKSFIVLAKVLEQSGEKVLGLTCEDIAKGVCRLVGSLTYEAVLELAVALSTAGVANSALLARLGPRLAKQFGKKASDFEPIVEAIRDLQKHVSDFEVPNKSLIDNVARTRNERAKLPEKISYNEKQKQNSHQYKHMRMLPDGSPSKIHQAAAKSAKTPPSFLNDGLDPQTLLDGVKNNQGKIINDNPNRSSLLVEWHENIGFAVSTVDGKVIETPTRFFAIKYIEGNTHITPVQAPSAH